MAGIHPTTVIYFIIAAQMETLQKISIIRNRLTMRAWVRLALTFVGTATAIICLFTLLSEYRSSASVATVSHLIEASKIVSRDFSVEVGGVNLSAMWPF
ncbi:MAG TPA: hypothetical protein VK666_16635 [Chryseolinea sp.]|nr:hypothetical protein [Chryseolinea sp.]